MECKKHNRNKKLKGFGIGIAIVAGYLVVIMIVSIVLKHCIPNISMKNIQTIYYVAQLSATMFVIVSAVVAVRQYYMYCEREKERSDVDYVQKAIDMAGFYKDHIITKYRPLYYVYEKTGVLNVLERVRTLDMNRFDLVELKELLHKEDIEHLRKIQASREFVEAIIEANTAYGINMGIEEGSPTDLVVNAFQSNIVSELLNDLEFFALHFVHETADDKVVFNSLHQTYLQIVHILYYSIASENSNISDKYYQNVIDLYINWNKKSRDTHEGLCRTASDSSRGTIVSRWKGY